MDRSAIRCASSALSMSSPDKSAWRTLVPIGRYPSAASASVMVVPVPPKSQSATTPLVGRPGSACNAVSAAAASEISVNRSGVADHSGNLANSRRSASAAAAHQCAGNVTPGGAVGAPPRATVRVRARNASAISTSPRWKEPSAATMPTGSPARSTNPVTTSPRWSRRGFSDGTPTSGGRCGYRVSTDCRVATAPPGPAAARLVAPTDSPTPCVMSRRLSPLGSLALPAITGD